MSKTVAIADDHAFTSAGMAQALETAGGLEIVAVLSNGIEAIAAIKRLKPDCAVIDLAMPGANGLEVVLEGRRWSPETRFAILTGSSSATAFRELLDTGVTGLFVKSMPPQAICKGIHNVAHGETVICEEAGQLLANLSNGRNLTAREIEVLQAIARGLSNIGISERLGVSIKTVESHRANLMRKLGVHSTATLLVRAMRDGLIDVTDSAMHSQSLPQFAKD
ncbi:MAG: LuxR C-terminal-related transcriptional regulator [Rhizobiaceae bacterium]